MPDYKTTTVTGTSYQRASSLTVRNDLDGLKGVTFFEERVVVIDGKSIAVPAGSLWRELTPDNAATSFSLLDGNGDPTGETATYIDVYLMLMSLYYHCAQERDGQ